MFFQVKNNFKAYGKASLTSSPPDEALNAVLILN